MDKKIFVTQPATTTATVEAGESYTSIFKFFFPEFIINLVLYSMPFILDGYFLSALKSTETYGTASATNTLIHFIIKVAEGMSVGTLILSGQSNGRGDLKEAGKILRHSFWVTSVFGIAIAAILYFGAPFIYRWYVPEEMVAMGVPFLQLRAISVLFMFLSMAFIGFLRGVKNTKTPMRVFIVGAIVFISCDYFFIFGAFGIPGMGLKGSALASVMQYLVMFIIVLARVMYAKKYEKYEIHIFSALRERIEWQKFMRLSWPVIIDKATMAFAYIWLTKMMRPLGVKGFAAFGAVREMERFGLIPAVALAQIITFLVSNDLGINNWQGIKNNTRKTLILAWVMVFAILVGVSFYCAPIMSCFDGRCEFSDIAAKVFPLLSILVFFDVLQLILSGSLRGATDVQVVMFARLIVCFCYFVPISYVLSTLPIENVTFKLLLIYGSFYLGNGLMSIVYINRLRNTWKSKTT